VREQKKREDEEMTRHNLKGVRGKVSSLNDDTDSEKREEEIQIIFNFHWELCYFFTSPLFALAFFHSRSSPSGDDYQHSGIVFIYAFQLDSHKKLSFIS
jgi:hypothetical protein